MLHLLPDLVSDSEEVYNGIVWQLVCCPFTPFLALFGEILANKGPKLEADWQALAAMQELPTFLKKMGVRNSLAAKLEHIAVVIVRHAESAVHTPQCTCELFRVFQAQNVARLITRQWQLQIWRLHTRTRSTISIGIPFSITPCRNKLKSMVWAVSRTLPVLEETRLCGRICSLVIPILIGLA
jgi:hypothetical protein